MKKKKLQHLIQSWYSYCEDDDNFTFCLDLASRLQKSQASRHCAWFQDNFKTRQNMQDNIQSEIARQWKHNGYNGAEYRSCHPWPFGLLSLKLDVFSFHVSGLSCSGHFDYFESLRGITFFLTQQLQIAEKSCFPPLPMEMLWIGGKGFLVAIIGELFRVESYL